MADLDVAARIRAARIVPVLRTATAAAAVEAATACLSSGLDVVELTATTPDWAEALRRLRADAPERLIGVGTVRDPATAGRAIDLGADFLVSPCPVPDVRAAVASAVLIEGGWTVAEVLDAGSRGLAKLFPAHVGGPAYLRTLLAIDPALRVIPTGGIHLADTRSWLDAGAFAVGVGSDLLTDEDPGAAIAAALA